MAGPAPRSWRRALQSRCIALCWASASTLVRTVLSRLLCVPFLLVCSVFMVLTCCAVVVLVASAIAVPMVRTFCYQLAVGLIFNVAVLVLYFLFFVVWDCLRTTVGGSDLFCEWGKHKYGRPFRVLISLCINISAIIPPFPAFVSDVRVQAGPY